MAGSRSWFSVRVFFRYKDKTMANDKIIIFDTTLRDGEQAPGFAMSKEEKLEMALALEDLGVDVIEAGFPMASPGESEALHAIAQNVKKSIICGLSRAVDKDIETCARSIAPAIDDGHGRIHTFISTSALHMEHKLRKSPKEVLEIIGKSVRHARQFTNDVEWSAEDGSRTDDDFLCRAVEIAIDAGASTINIPDTVGYADAQDCARQFNMLRERVPNIDKAILSTHCHDDLGQAVANSLASVHAGVRQVECTINGIGERAGNAALEEVVMAIRVRRDKFPYQSRIDTTKLTPVSQLLTRITGVAVPPNKSVVGANAFGHASGIHQDGLAKDARTYEIMSAESVGQKRMTFTFTKHSGLSGFRQILKDNHIVLEEEGLKVAFHIASNIAETQKTVSNDEILAIVKEFKNPEAVLR